MLTLNDGTLILAASDLTDHLACPHLTQQRLAIARGERSNPRPTDDPHADLIRERGDRHELEQLARLRDVAGEYVDLSGEIPRTREQVEAAAEDTAAAMRAGAPLIFQAQFLDGCWQGRTDFLRRVARPSELGDYSYEVLDTKLARQVKPPVVHQLSLYSHQLAAVQGAEPEHAHVVLGDGSEVSIELGRYAALHRHLVARLEHICSEPTLETYPEPVAHCDICALAAECRERWIEDDHLSLVAGARRDQREQLVEIGLPTLRALAEANGQGSAQLSTERFERLHEQAALQLASRESGEPTHRHLAPALDAGYARLPDPSSGDVFFDLEGDPYVGDNGIEYLWGWWTAEGDYECTWAHDEGEEKAAIEAFVDRVVELRGRHPDLHIYHYAPHEVSTLRSLSVEYATREDEIDTLLRGEVFVDLYAVVRQGLQVGEEGYSLKKLERHHGFRRLEHRVREGGGSIVAYETWLESSDPEILEAIRAYNEEDCRSTASLRDWLLNEMRPEAEEGFGIDFADYREPESGEERESPKWMPEIQELIDQLSADLPVDGVDDSIEQAERRLLSHLLLYHHREAKPAWWRYYDLLGMSMDDLIDDRDALAGLERDELHPPSPYKRSLEYRFSFPPQEFRLHAGKTAEDPKTGETHNVAHLADDHVVLRRAANKPPPAPQALIDAQPIKAAVLRAGLADLARAVMADDGRYPAARALLRGEPPALPLELLDADPKTLISAALTLGRSILPIQGPPGTGKTFRAARMVVAAVSAGMRVGVTARSHAAIQNLLREVEVWAAREGVEPAGIYKGSGYTSEHDLIEETDDYSEITDEHRLVAGTTWLFARSEYRNAFDILLIDEAGQYALADALASALAADGVVLLGDPQQLPQVTQADHPDGSGDSTLEHLLQGAQTMPPGRGVLLTESWRMHPEICAFISERSYESRLGPRESCGLRRVDASEGALTGAGLRVLAVQHEGRSQASPEEADEIADACHGLLVGTTVTDDEGVVRELMPSDILVVAPYNLAVRCIRDRVPDGVRVGTVDRFQGQEAPVVFFAMTCSSGDDVPRGLSFLFDAHRLNVAISRAQCLAVLVYSPRLLDADCPTIEAMQLVDGACRFAELAQGLGAAGVISGR